MVRFSNKLIGILNVLTLLLSIPILITGVWLSKQAGTNCIGLLERPFVTLGIFLLIVSLVGLIGVCCRITWLLWLYLLVMSLLIIFVFAYTVFAFVVTNKGSGEALPGKTYREYRLGSYSNWMQKMVNNAERWNRFKNCLQSGKYCSQFRYKYKHDTANTFYNEKLLALESGCCKPSNDCKFVYQSPTVWNKPQNATYSNPDCDAWSNDSKVLCFNCQSCKAGLLQSLKTVWKVVAVVIIIFLILLIIVLSIVCCALRNIRRDN